MDKQQIIWLQRQREQDPQHDIDAQRRFDLWKKRITPYQDLINLLIVRAKKATEPKNKVKYLREIADKVIWAFQGVVPCKDGCSHCCNMPTLMTQEEADVIGQEIKRPAVRPRRYTMEGNATYTGVPCPFLKDNRCSIYRFRPYVCRLHVSIDKDDLLCNLASVAVQPQWDSRMFHVAELEAFYGKGDKMPRLADIREFFPPKD